MSSLSRIEARESVMPITPATTSAAGEDLTLKSIVGIQMPAAWTGADITFTGATSLTGTYNPITDSGGNIITLTVAKDEAITLTEAHRLGVAAWPFVKLVVSVAQVAARTLSLMLEERPNWRG